MVQRVGGVQVQVGADTFAVTSREATGEELDRYWPRLTKLWPAYETFHNDGGRRSRVLEPGIAGVERGGGDRHGDAHSLPGACAALGRVCRQ
ncbi:nitroreductase/quinone reductase family protein [Intrasporangium mesophilum]